jgi:CheY-like chemotaxis protein
MESPSRNGKTLLLVEDDVDLRETLAEILRLQGFDPVTAGSGAEAFEILRQGEAPRVILLDLMMPEMSGWEFRDVQRRDPALASIPVVLISGVSDLAEAAEATHASAFLSKPVDIDVLVRLLTRYCG